MLSDFQYRLRALFRRRTIESDLDDELRFHFEQQVEKSMRAGLTRSEAVRQTRLEFGGMEQVKEECREARGVAAGENLAQDIRHARTVCGGISGLARTVVTAIGLGIFVNTAAFTLVCRGAVQDSGFRAEAARTGYIPGSQPYCKPSCVDDALLIRISASSGPMRSPWRRWWRVTFSR